MFELSLKRGTVFSPFTYASLLTVPYPLIANQKHPLYTVNYFDEFLKFPISSLHLGALFNLLIGKVNEKTSIHNADQYYHRYFSRFHKVHFLLSYALL